MVLADVLDFVPDSDAIEEMTAAELVESGLSSGIEGGDSDTFMLNPVGGSNSGKFDMAEINDQSLLEVESKTSQNNFASTVFRAKSISVFSLALMGMGMVVVFAGLFGLSFSQKIENIDRQEFFIQLRSLSFRSIRWNVSKNWGVKKDATWFVIIGLCSAFLGFLDWIVF